MNDENLEQNNDHNNDNKNATTLCVISIICTVVSVICGPLARFVEVLAVSNGNSVAKTFTGIFTALASLGSLAGLTLMIVARVKYPKSKFAKVLMWVYIAFFILAVTLVILISLAILGSCILLLDECSNFS